MWSASKLLPALLVACATAGAAPSPPAPPFPMEGAAMPRFIIDRWVNSRPLQPEDLRGKVVLVDFWEYTCVNCIRTLPYVKAWNARYAPVGLVVIGVHAPEFEFGKRAENIDRGIKDHGLTYPIAIDNDFSTWTAYRNRAWPAKYLFDATGHLRGVWIGEGGDPEIEEAIRKLLVEAGVKKLPERTAEVRAYKEREAGGPITPETYLGTARREGDWVARVGSWESKDEYIEHVGEEAGKIVLDFVGGEVNLVMQPPAGGAAARVQLTLDGRAAGAITVDHAGMYRLVEGVGKGKHRLDVETAAPGLRAFAFTFGP